MPKINLTENDKINLPEPDSDGLFTVESRIKVDGDSAELVEVMGKQYKTPKEKPDDLFNNTETNNLLGL